MAQVICSRCGQRGESPERVPISGKLGQAVLAQVCRNCWSDWVRESLMIINHYGLQPLDPNDRQQLYSYMRQYLHLPEESV